MSRKNTSTSFFGVAALFVGFFCSLAVVLYTTRWLDAYFAGKRAPSTGILYFILGSLVGALVLQALRNGQEEPEQDFADLRGRDETAEPSRFAWVKWALLWGIPVVAYWVQFELFVAHIYISPLLCLLGSVSFTLSVAGKLPENSFKRSLTFLAVIVLGLPLGVLSFSLPTHHFNRYGTKVTWLSTNRLYDDREYHFEAAELDVIEAPLVGTDELEALVALATAKPIDPAEKIRKGEWVEKDGVFFVVLPDGSHEEILTGEAAVEFLDEESEKAKEKDHKRFEEQKKAQLAAWKKSQRGGRLFSTP